MGNAVLETRYPDYRVARGFLIGAVLAFSGELLEKKS
jgi:hypothetical protein